MSGMMLHGLGDCTPERNCGCMAKSPSRDALRERPPMRRPLLVFALWITFSLIVTGALVAAAFTSQVAGPLAAILAAGVVTIWGTEKWA